LFLVIPEIQNQDCYKLLDLAIRLQNDASYYHTFPENVDQL
jgi:hypothetical protein